MSEPKLDDLYRQDSRGQFRRQAAVASINFLKAQRLLTEKEVSEIVSRLKKMAEVQRLKIKV